MNAWSFLCFTLAVGCCCLWHTHWTAQPGNDALAYTEATINPRSLAKAATARWRKAKGYTTVLALAIIDSLFMLFCLVRNEQVLAPPVFAH
jgi:hypothetical protein